VLKNKTKIYAFIPSENLYLSLQKFYDLLEKDNVILHVNTLSCKTKERRVVFQVRRMSVCVNTSAMERSVSAARSVPSNTLRSTQVGISIVAVDFQLENH